ncbi:hypothetical protein V5O48_005046 [Marasmius crinis-equi]|uniref:Cytochrome c oxidase assembly protein COX20, mitochondrial n=1 Tax=Marasmius crinis-equi TaxID=585013 RepID=A0ABR3FND3_9AGAR
MSESAAPPPPPPPTSTENKSKRDEPKYNGELSHDAMESLKHLGAVPCARNSLLTGLASGAGMAFIRGVSVSEERKKVQQIIESSPKRVLKKEADDSDSVPAK